MFCASVYHVVFSITCFVQGGESVIFNIMCFYKFVLCCFQCRVFCIGVYHVVFNIMCFVQVCTVWLLYNAFCTGMYRVVFSINCFVQVCAMFSVSCFLYKCVPCCFQYHVLYTGMCHCVFSIMCFVQVCSMLFSLSHVFVLVCTVLFALLCVLCRCVPCCFHHRVFCTGVYHVVSSIMCFIQVCTVFWIALILHKVEFFDCVINLRVPHTIDEPNDNPRHAWSDRHLEPGSTVVHEQTVRDVTGQAGLRSDDDGAAAGLLRHADLESWRGLSHKHWPTFFGLYNFSLSGRLARNSWCLLRDTIC